MCAKVSLGVFQSLGGDGVSFKQVACIQTADAKRPVHLSHNNNSLPFLVGYTRLYHVHGYTAELSRHQTNTNGNAYISQRKLA